MKKTTQTKASQPASQPASRAASRAAKSQTELTAAYDSHTKASLAASQLAQMAADNAKQLARQPAKIVASPAAENEVLFDLVFSRLNDDGSREHTLHRNKRDIKPVKAARFEDYGLNFADVARFCDWSIFGGECTVDRDYWLTLCDMDTDVFTDGNGHYFILKVYGKMYKRQPAKNAICKLQVFDYMASPMAR